MIKNIINIPPELYQSDLPTGYDCTMYVGRMAGRGEDRTVIRLEHFEPRLNVGRVFWAWIRRKF